MTLSEQNRRKLDEFIDLPQRRSISLDSRAVHIDEDKRTIRVAFSSDAEIPRWFGMEVLGHGADEVSLDRFEDGAAVLINHDQDKHIGVIEKAWIDGSTGRAILRFGSSAKAGEVFQDVVDGIWRHVSIGYFIHEMVLEKQVDDGPDIYRVTQWQPFELSLVAIPADTSVGVGRSNLESIHEDITMTKETTSRSRSQTRADRKIDADELERVTNLRAIGEQYDAKDLAELIIQEGGSEQVLNKMILDRGGMPATKVEDPSIGLTPDEIQKYSLCRAILAAAYPSDRKYQEAAALEIACSEAARGQLERNVRGNLYVPAEVLRQPRGQRNLIVGTPAQGGDLVATDLLVGSFIDLLRNASVVQAAGAMVLQGLVGNVAIPRQTGAESVFWLAENAAPSESNATFDQVPLTPKTIGAYSEISRKLLLQGTPEIEGLVTKSLADTIAIEIDRVAIEGSGAGEEPTGILNHAGVGVVDGDVNGLAPTYANIVALESSVAVPNALIGRLAYVTNAKAVGDLKQISVDAGSGRFLLEGRVDNGRQSLVMNGYLAIMSNNVPSDLTKGTGSDLSAIVFGNWQDLIIGLWSGLDLQVNPFSLDTSGQIRITAFQDLDIALRHPQSFSVILDVITTT